MVKPPVPLSRAVEPREHAKWVNMLISTVHALLVAPFALQALFGGPCGEKSAALMRFGSSVDTVNGEVPVVHMLLPVTFGYLIYDLGAMCAEASLFTWLFLLHHLGALIFWPISVLHGRGVYYVVYCLATEASTPFLNQVTFFLPKHGMEQSLVFQACGVLFLVLFLGMRVAAVPFLIHGMKEALPFWQAEDGSIFWMWCCSVPVPMALNCYWGFLVILGCVRPARDEDKAKEKAS